MSGLLLLVYPQLIYGPMISGGKFDAVHVVLQRFTAPYHLKLSQHKSLCVSESFAQNAVFGRRVRHIAAPAAVPKIQQKLEELEAELNIKDQSQAGMQRMHVAYTQNPQLGDPAKVAEQLLQNQQEMHTAQGELNQPLGGNPHQHQAAQQQMHNAKTTTTTSSSLPGSSPRGTTAVAAGSAPAPPCQQHVPYVDTGSGDFYEECDTPAAAAANGCPVPQQQSDVVLGTAIAMYAYDAAPDEVGGTTISMRDGDELLLLERDVGDGWTRVRHMQSNAEGFVPSSYLECKWYSTDA
ncbi:hypothetical protein GPALN_011590 [Globodera pallida]|nr:hypothetical protein GPALN_011590 [Globodera pallida]